MSKKEKNIFSLVEHDIDPVLEVTKHLNKKGNLKGSKKEVKTLRSICCHHVMNKKGKVKPKIHEENRNCKCPICKDKFRPDFYSDQEYDKAYNGYKPIVSQAKFLAVATGASKTSVQRVAGFSLDLDRFGKTYKNLRSVAQKQDKVKNKKKRRKETEDLGSWKFN